MPARFFDAFAPVIDPDRQPPRLLFANFIQEQKAARTRGRDDLDGDRSIEPGSRPR